MTMNKLNVFNKIMSKAKEGGYRGDDYKNRLGFILDGTNIYSLIFREDFAKAFWGKGVSKWGSDGVKIEKWTHALKLLSVSEDKWAFLHNSLDQ